MNTGNNIYSLPVDIEEVGFSDHHLVSWSLDIKRDQLAYTTTRRRIWKDFDAAKLKSDLLASELCTPSMITTSDLTVEQLVPDMIKH